MYAQESKVPFFLVHGAMHAYFLPYEIQLSTDRGCWPSYSHLPIGGCDYFWSNFQF